jgi:hypothetical protein
MEVGRVGDLRIGMAALCASRWSAIGCIDGRRKNLSKKERPEANRCLPLVGSLMYG